MNKKLLIILIIFVLIIGVFYYILKSGNGGQGIAAGDKSSSVLNDLKKQSGVSFSKITDSTFVWDTYVEDATSDTNSFAVKGKEFSVEGIDSGSYEAIIQYFEGNGFEAVFIDPTGGSSEYQKSNIGCVVLEASASGKINAGVSCGELTN